MKRLQIRLYRIIFGTDTPAGKAFDIFLLIAIILSVLIFMLESIAKFELQYGTILHLSEWIITIIFTIEYFLRIAISKKPLSYVFSFFGIIDLLSILPTYIAIFVSDTHFLAIVRALRLLRIFRILNLSLYEAAGKSLLTALRSSKNKIGVFLYAVVVIVVVIGTLMFYVEGEENGFTSIPRSIYWAIVTLTTVGYGDITPQTNFGQLIASMIMIMGYAIIAVPTGIVSAEIVSANKQANREIPCPNCSIENDPDANFCKNCGQELICEFRS